MATIKKKVTGVGEDMQKLELSYTDGRIAKRCSCFRKQFVRRLNIVTIWPRNLTSTDMPWKIDTYSHKNLYMNIPSSIVYHSQKNGNKSPSNVEWIDKIWYIHIMEYYVAVKKKWSIDIWYNVCEPWKHYAKLKKPVPKNWILYGLITINIQNR